MPKAETRWFKVISTPEFTVYTIIPTVHPFFSLFSIAIGFKEVCLVKREFFVLFGVLPALFKDEDELRSNWSNPLTQRTQLQKLGDAGIGKEELTVVQK